MRNAMVFLLVAGLGLATPARGDEPPGESQVTRARSDAATGLALFHAGRWAEAYDTFRKADAVYHAPTLVLYMAHCQKRLGRPASAQALYRKVADEPLPRDAPLQFTTAQAVAREELRALEPRVPTLELTLDGSAGRSVRVTLDGEPAAAAPRQRIVLDPGTHEIAVAVDGGPPLRQMVKLSEGSKEKLVMTLPGPAPIVVPPPAQVRPSRGSRTPALLAFGAGAAAFAVGTATGAASLGRVAELRGRCRPSGACPASEQATAAEAGRLADASTAALVITGLALATGVVLLVVRPRGPSTPVRVGPGSVTIEGVF